MTWKPQVDVPQHGCGYLHLFMAATGVLSGTVVRADDGKPVPGLELDVLRLRGTDETIPGIEHEKTGANGSFHYEGIPAGDYLIGVNLWSRPNVDTPYAPTYLPGVSDRDRAQVIHLAAGQKLSGFRLKVPTRLRLRTVRVQVQWPDGSSVGQGVSVTTYESENSVTDFEETKADGSTSVQCFAAKGCLIEAKKWLTKPGEEAAPQLAASLPKQVEAGDAPVSITLTLTENEARGTSEPSEPPSSTREVQIRCRCSLCFEQPFRTSDRLLGSYHFVTNGMVRRLLTSIVWGIRGERGGVPWSYMRLASIWARQSFT